MFVYRLAFGSGQLSLWHFRKVSYDTIQYWNDTERLSLTVFPAKLLPPVASKFSSIRDLQDALTNVLSFASYYGSPAFQQFAHAAKSFMESGLRLLQVSDADTPALHEWFDSQFQGFTLDLILDIQQHREPPRHVVSHHCFDTSGSRFSSLLLRLHAARSSPPPIPAAFPAAGKKQYCKQNSSTQQGRLPPMPDNLQRHVPKQDGHPCCLRALCNAGCNAKVKDGCCGMGSYKKAHFKPPSLNKGLAQWAANRWGGFAKDNVDLLQA